MDYKSTFSGYNGKLIYVCSPYRGNEIANKEKAIKYCRYVIEHGLVPIAPHLYFTTILDDSDEEERYIGLQLGTELLTHCSELWVFGDVLSDGMRYEIEYAIAHIKPRNLNFVIRFIKESDVVG